jgi:hypothetical protein
MAQPAAKPLFPPIPVWPPEPAPKPPGEATPVPAPNGTQSAVPAEKSSAPPPPSAAVKMLTQSEPPQPLSPALKYSAIAGACLAAMALVGYLVFGRNTEKPLPADLLSAVEENSGVPGLEFSLSDRQEHPVNRHEVSGKFVAKAILPQALFVQVNTVSFLQAHDVDLNRLRKSSGALAGPEGKRLRELAGFTDLPVNPLDLILLEERAHQGQEVVFNVSYGATRKSKGVWDITVECTPVGSKPAGRPKSSFMGNILIVSDPHAVASLQDLVDKQFAFDEKVAAAREQFQDALRKEQEARVAHFAEFVKPGSLFTGTATSRNGETYPLSLEFTAASGSTSRRVQALLRNDGGWQDTRSFQGDWDVDASAERMVLALRSPASQAMPGAGPFLSAGDAWMLELTASADSTELYGQTSGYSYKFEAVAAADVARVRSELRASHQAYLDATAPGMVYRGTVSYVYTQSVENVFLHFVRQEDNGAQLIAVLESTEHPAWRRYLRGSVVSSKYRSGGKPVRLESAAGRRIRRAPEESVFNPLMYPSPTFTLEGNTLRGKDENFRYSLTAVSKDGLSEHLAANKGYETPSFPSQPGAYVLHDGRWDLLPANGGKPGTGFKSVAKHISAFFSSLSKDDDSEPKDVRIGDLIFDGTDPVPAVKSDPLVIVFVGPVKPFSADALSHNPDLKYYPALEIAHSTVHEDGKRSADLYRIAPTLSGFGEKRLSADVETPLDGVTLLTCSGALESGSYALNVPNSTTPAFEFKVQR